MAFVINDSYNIISHRILSCRISNIGISFTQIHTHRQTDTHTHRHTDTQTRRHTDNLIFSLSDSEDDSNDTSHVYAPATCGLVPTTTNPLKQKLRYLPKNSGATLPKNSQPTRYPIQKLNQKLTTHTLPYPKTQPKSHNPHSTLPQITPVK
jgi:hypothetical protein